ncbi:MAG: aromatic hydrocarbon degradation protein, partial [Methylococcales bacterium]|nr:aromatic hydrocarbon degradation protein [Methylococcales bacterium]
MNYKKHILSTAVTACLLLPQISFATNGAFSHGFGTKNKSMAGAGVASPQSAFASAL